MTSPSLRSGIPSCLERHDPASSRVQFLLRIGPVRGEHGRGALLARQRGCVLILLLSLVAGAVPEVPCATPQLYAEVVDPALALPPPPDGLGLRDAYGVPNVETSEHFALRFGNEREIPRADRERLLAAFEQAYEVEIVEMGHTRPYGFGEYYFNVYIGDTGSGAPSGAGAGGYYTPDAENWPMIVIAADSLYSADYTWNVAAHEFYHAIQGATNRFDYNINGPSAWFWEATANWASAIVHPDLPDHARNLPGYAFFPHKRLNFFDYPDSGAITESYQYGAFIFPLHVSDRLGTWEPIRDVWEDEGTSQDPLTVMREKVEERGFDFDELWLDHVARNTIWDYPNGDVYRGYIANWGRFDESRNVVAGSIPNLGTQGYVEGPSRLSLERYGSHTLTMRAPMEGTYTLTVQGDQRGTEGGAALWGGTVVITRLNQDPEYVPIDFEGARGELVLDDIDDASKVYVTVGVWTAGSSPRWGVENFEYSYQMAFEPLPEPVIEPEKGGCACDSTSPGMAWWLLPVAALLLRRRR